MKLIKDIFLYIASLFIRISIFMCIYNWFVPIVFTFMPVINFFESAEITILIDFILCDKADHIYDKNTDTFDIVFYQNINYLIYFGLAYIIKIICGI